jgi:hypothetical protein
VTKLGTREFRYLRSAPVSTVSRSAAMDTIRQKLINLGLMQIDPARPFLAVRTPEGDAFIEESKGTP